jgi:hypothetical protein
MQQKIKLTHGIDLLVMRQSLGIIFADLSGAFELTSNDIVGLEFDIMQKLEVLQRPFRATISSLHRSDFPSRSISTVMRQNETTARSPTDSPLLSSKT